MRGKWARKINGRRIEFKSKYSLHSLPLAFIPLSFRSRISARTRKQSLTQTVKLLQLLYHRMVVYTHRHTHFLWKEREGEGDGHYLVNAHIHVCVCVCK